MALQIIAIDTRTENIFFIIFKLVERNNLSFQRNNQSIN